MKGATDGGEDWRECCREETESVEGRGRGPLVREGGGLDRTRRLGPAVPEPKWAEEAERGVGRARAGPARLTRVFAKAGRGTAEADGAGKL